MNRTSKDGSPEGCSRRAFLGQGVAGAAALGLGAATTSATAADTGRTTAEENPWRYDVDALRRVDPALVHFERVSGFTVASPAVRRFHVTPDGVVRVAAGRAVWTFEETGRRTSVLEIGEVVRAVGVAPDGAVFVGLRDRVECWSAEGRRLARWTAFSGKPYLTGFAFAGEEVYVADAGNRVVYRCDRSGRVQLRIGERNPDRNIPGLVLPSPFLDVEVGEDGLLRVNNPGRHRVEAYTRDGDLELSWGRAGVAIDAFCGCCNPIQLAALPGGSWVTAEKGLPRVKVHHGDGRLASVVAVPDQFAAVASEDRGVKTTTDTLLDGLDVAVDGKGRVWVLDLVGATVQVFRRKADAGTSV